MISRRQFLQSAAGATLAVTLRARQLSSIGAELYTVREVLPRKPAETLKAIREIGYQTIEPTYEGFDKIWPVVRESGLRPVAMHLDKKLIAQGSDAVSRVVDELKRYGFQYAVHPYVDPADRGGPETIKRLADQLNLLGEKCRAAGMQGAYHNHAFESAPAGGQTLFELLVERTDPKLVGFEVDTFWISVAGGDPAAFVRTLGARAMVVHLKDKAAGTTQRFDEGVPKTAFQEVGSGVMDWPAILRACAEAGVKHYFVEQDQTPGDPLDSLRKSYEYLAKLNY